MMNRGVQEVYYTRQLPARAVAIAAVSTAVATPAQLVDINNTPVSAGSLGVWNSLAGLSGSATFVAEDYGVPLEISGSTTYGVANPFFELTNRVTASQTKLFYKHQFPAAVTDVKILTLAGEPVTADTILEGNVLYHNLDGGAYRVRYVEGTRIFVQLLRYDPVLAPAVYAPSTSMYVLNGRALEVVSADPLFIRFVAPNGYQVRPPYTSLPNAPWFVRVGTSLTLPSPEWARQVFLPQRPYMLGTWVAGQVLDSRLIEFERKHMLDDPSRRPDILVFTKDYAFKYALEGSSIASPRRHGTMYRWKRGQVVAVDPSTARVEIALDLASDDVVYGFYSYREPDVIYTALDVNPFTNPVVKNRIVKFYCRPGNFQVIYHQVCEPNGTPVSTNDPTPPATLSNVFAEMVVGVNVGVSQMSFVDVRQRGGGLATPHQSRPEAVNFWDLGYWDGKPYPIGAALVVYLPARILDTMSRADVKGKVEAVLPMGVCPVIRYYQPTGEELV